MAMEGQVNTNPSDPDYMTKRQLEGSCMERLKEIWKHHMNMTGAQTMGAAGIFLLEIPIEAR